MSIKENKMRAFCSIVTVFSMENIENFLREKLDGFYEESECDGFDARLVLKKDPCLPDIKICFESQKIDRLLNVEFLIASKLDGSKEKKEYALCVATYGIKDYEKQKNSADPMIEAAKALKNRVWTTSCRSSGSNKTIVFPIIKFLLENLDRSSGEKNASIANDKTELSIIVPDSKCCEMTRLEKRPEEIDKGEGLSFAFVYFSAARGENGDDIRKPENNALHDGVFGAIEQAVSAEGGKNHAAEIYRSILYDVATFSQPTGVSLIKMGYEYNPSEDKEYGKILAWNYYEKYYFRFCEALLARIDIYLKMKELRKVNDQKNVTSAIKDKVRIFMGQIEDLDECCHAVIKTSASGVAAIWLDNTNTESLVVSKARKECSIFYDNVREKEEQKKEEEQKREEELEKKKEEAKDRTDALFSIFTVLALMSCVWDGYCLIKEFTTVAFLLFVFSFSVVVIVCYIVFKASSGIIRSYLKKNIWIVVLFILGIITIIAFTVAGEIPIYNDSSQIVANQTVEIQYVEKQTKVEQENPDQSNFSQLH